MYIALDAMGGDLAPQAVVAGAVQAAREYGVSLLLVGDQEKIRQELSRNGQRESSQLAIQHASEVIEMGDSPVAALRRKRDSSLRVAFAHVKAGKAGAVVSAGNSGAVLGLAVTMLGCLPDVDRPAIVTVVPALTGRTCLVDAGANVECKPLHLVQFAIMGEVYARVVRGIESPSVGVLSNGEEESKGTETTRAAHAVLKGLPLNYIGYIEGRALNSGAVDVVVTDGFTGNIALKTMEGFYDFTQGQLRSLFSSNWRGKLAFLLLKRSFADLRARIDYDEVGGAPLLGTDGVTIIAHGSSSPKAIKNAIRVAHESLQGGVNQHITESLRALPDTAVLTAGDGRGRKIWSQLRQKFLHTKDAGEKAGAPLKPDKINQTGRINQLDKNNEPDPPEPAE